MNSQPLSTVMVRNTSRNRFPILRSTRFSARTTLSAVWSGTRITSPHRVSRSVSTSRAALDPTGPIILSISQWPNVFRARTSGGPVLDGVPGGLFRPLPAARTPAAAPFIQQVFLRQVQEHVPR